MLNFSDAGYLLDSCVHGVRVRVRVRPCSVLNCIRYLQEITFVTSDTFQEWNETVYFIPVGGMVWPPSDMCVREKHRH